VKDATELIARILEVAQLREDTDEGGLVEMPEEQEWGEIVGLARKLAQTGPTRPSGAGKGEQ
jgi:hypothetical protein